MVPEPLLTIAIPTYNRSKILCRTLQTYVDDPDFDDRVEIAVSDNCSTDDTQEIVSSFSVEHQNIFYHRNAENISDRNFAQALSLGSGKYVKLTNDTAEPKPGALKVMLDAIGKSAGTNDLLLFYQNEGRHVNSIVSTEGMDSFIRVASFYAGWILNFGAWRSDFAELTEKDRCAKMQFAQVDWTLRLVQQKERVRIYFHDYFIVRDPGKKAVYNIFELFLGNYLAMYDEYLAVGEINHQTIKIEKRNLFRCFFVPWVKNIFITRVARDSFTTDKYLQRLFFRYWRYPYFYSGLLKLVVLKLLYLNGAVANIFERLKKA